MRLHLILAVVTGLCLFFSLRGIHHRFTFARVEALAAARAAQPYVAPKKHLPPQLAKLSSQQSAVINWKDAYRLWRKNGLPFQVDFYHVTKDNVGGPRINTVGRKGENPLAYSSTFFSLGNLVFDPPLPGDLPFAGFYLRYPINKADSLDGFFSVLGAQAVGGGSYFRAIAKDQIYGLSARGLALNTGFSGPPEEFPDFTDWWLYQPTSNASEMTLNALLDSPSVVGAYEFKVRPGAVTSVDIHASLYFRKPVAHLGVAPFSSMYLYGENSKDHLGNFHPEIHDSDGLLVNYASGEWIWRPLQQAPMGQIYNFPGTPEAAPRGFGLLERDRDVSHFQDLEMKYNARPSAWVTPHGNWGKGVVQLIHNNSTDVNNDNVVAFWTPEKSPRAGDHLTFDYTIDFYMNDAERPPLAYCRSTVIGYPPPGPPKQVQPVQFNFDFFGNGLERIPSESPPDVELSAAPDGAAVQDVKLEKNGYDNSWRVSFTLLPARRFVPSELICRLTRDGKPLTETWSYTWHQ